MRVLTLALRRLADAPWFTLFSVATLAAGIGVTTAVYSFLYATVWRDSTVPEPDRVVLITQHAGYHARFSGPEVADLAAQQTVFRAVAAWSGLGTSLSGRGTPRLVRGEAVTGAFFSVLQIQALRGRTVQPDDDRPGAPPVIVLAESTWRGQFGADPAVVGTTVRLASQPYEVIGVMPAAAGHWRPRGRASDFWVPASTAPRLGLDRQFGTADRGYRVFDVVARLGPGRELEATAPELQVIGERLEALSPLDRQLHQARRVVATPLTASGRSATDTEMSRLVFALPALVLLIACTNLANLALSRGTSRRHEFAVRCALGASRWQVIRSQLIEGGIVAVAGGLGGIALARVLATYATSVIERSLGTWRAPEFEFSLEMPVLIAAGAAAAGSLLISTLAPSLQLTRTTVRGALASDTPVGALPRWRGRSNLIALQVAASVGLFLLAALCVRGIASSRQEPASGTSSHLAMVTVPFGVQQANDDIVRARIEAIVNGLRPSPAVASVAVSSAVGWGARIGVEVVQVTSPDRPFVANVQEGLSATTMTATPNLPRVLGLPLVHGRAFDDRDDAASRLVALVTASLARKVFGVPDAVGRDLLLSRRFNRAGHLLRRADVERVTVVGVLAHGFDRRGHGDDVVYFPVRQQFDANVSLIAASASSDVTAAAAALREAVHATDPDLAIDFAGPLAMGMRHPGLLVLHAMTAGAFGLALLALLLSMAGLYGVLAHVVNARTRELGVRMALGASRPAIVRLVLKDGFRPVIEGAVIGFGSAAALGLWLKSTFSEIELTAIDPLAIAVGIGPLLIAATIACYFPARRAARVDPNVALREL